MAQQDVPVGLHRLSRVVLHPLPQVVEQGAAQDGVPVQGDVVAVIVPDQPVIDHHHHVGHVPDMLQQGHVAVGPGHADRRGEGGLLGPAAPLNGQQKGRQGPLSQGLIPDLPDLGDPFHHCLCPHEITSFCLHGCKENLYVLSENEFAPS